MRTGRSWFIALGVTVLSTTVAQAAQPTTVNGAPATSGLPFASTPVSDGRLAFGTWQGIYLFEHRSSPHRREVVLHLA